MGKYGRVWEAAAICYRRANARLPRRSVTKPGVCGEQKNGKIIVVLSAKILKKSGGRCIVCNDCNFNYI